MSDNKLTDEMGVKLARYLAASSTIKTLGHPSLQLLTDDQRASKLRQ